MRSRNFAMAPISIHALCEEGDLPTSIMRDMKDYFYPRPLRGGRLAALPSDLRAVIFLSTPSARRATHRRNPERKRPRHFYPRPLRGGRRPGRVHVPR